MVMEAFEKLRAPRERMCRRVSRNAMSPKEEYSSLEEFKRQGEPGEHDTTRAKKKIIV